MTPEENKALLALDRLVEANPAILTHRQIRLYRDLLIRYIGLVSCGPAHVCERDGRAGSVAAGRPAARARVGRWRVGNQKRL